MRTVQLFDTAIDQLGTERQGRTWRAGKVLYQLVKQGGKGVNPVAVWLDAAVAVSDCISSFLRYKQSKEITEQLQWQKRSLEQQLHNMGQALDIEQQIWGADQQQRLQLVDNLLQEDKQAAERMLKRIRSHRKSLNTLLKQINAMRKHSQYYSPEFKALLNATDKLMQAQLACLVAAFDE